MEENFLIDIVSKQTNSKDNDEIRVKSRGTLKSINGSTYICYKDYSDKTPSTCIIKCKNNDCVSIIRGGNAKTKLILENGKRHYCPYYTEAGLLTLGVSTKNIDSNFSDEFAKLVLEYSLDVNSEFLSKNKVTVTATKIKDEVRAQNV